MYFTQTVAPLAAIVLSPHGAEPEIVEKQTSYLQSMCLLHTLIEKLFIENCL